MDHTSELESMAAHHQHVNSDEEEDMLLEELDLKTPKQISNVHHHYAAVYGSIAKSRTERHQAPRIKRLPHIMRNSLQETVWTPKVISLGPIHHAGDYGTLEEECSGWFKGTGVWKLPTGTVEEAEDYEVLGFRESHKSFFQKSDMFFVCMLQARSFDTQTQTSEIAGPQWVKMEKYGQFEKQNSVAKICMISHTRDVSLKGRDHHNKNRANILQKASSWITVVTFPGCLLLSNYRPYSSLCNEQRSFFSIWLPLLGMLNFTAFLSSLFLMVICGAHFIRLHVIAALLLISAMLI